MQTKKRIVISCGPIPARLDSVKFITNRFKGGLAFKTADALAYNGREVTIVTWKFTEVPEYILQNEHIREIVRVSDVFEYYDWFVANAKNFDAFVMAAAVANLTPVKPYEGKFPSHNYKPGDEFDIKFMIAPRAIDVIKQINPRACLIGYKLFDTDDEDELIDIARHTLADAKANLIFANRPKDAKTKKIAVTADNSAFACTFSQHVELISRAINQTYFKTEIQPLTDDELNDGEILAAMELVRAFEKTFPKYGTVAFPVKNNTQFVTTSRGHKGNPVLVRKIDHKTNTIYASAKATLNAPTMGEFTRNGHYAVHRHYDDPNANSVGHVCSQTTNTYIFPGTVEEWTLAKTTVENHKDRLAERFHGYIQSLPFGKINWDAYHETFPDRYFGTPAEMIETIETFKQKVGKDRILEVGGNQYPDAGFSLDPYVRPKNGAEQIDFERLKASKFEFAFARNSICYLSPDEIRLVLKSCKNFMANAPAKMPKIKIRDNEIAAKTEHGKIVHYLMLDNDQIIRHEFFAYDQDFYKSLGLTVKQYRANSILLTWQQDQA